MTDKPQKTRTLGYVNISALEHLAEWKAYTAAVSLADKARTKVAVRDKLKAQLPDLPDDAVIDFIKYDEGRIQVFHDLQPKKASKRRGTDLSDLFSPKKKK